MSLPILAPGLYFYGAVYFVLSALARWRLKPDLTILLYFSGAVIGLHLIEFFEYGIYTQARGFIKPTTSVLKSAFVQILLIPITFFVLTSTASRIGAGVVLFLNLRLFYAQYVVWRGGALGSWLNGVVKNPTPNAQRWYIHLLAAVFICETLIFVAL